MTASSDTTDNTELTWGQIGAEYKRSIGLIGEYLAYDFLKTQSLQRFSSWSTLHGKELRGLRPPPEKHHQGSDLFAYANEPYAPEVLAKKIKELRAEYGLTSFDRAYQEKLQEIKRPRCIPQVFEVKANSAIEGEGNLGDKQKRLDGILKYAADSMNMSPERLRDKHDNYVHAYLIHITGLQDYSSFGVFLDFYDWKQCVLDDIDAFSLNSPNARGHLLGTWVLSDSIFEIDVPGKNRTKTINGRKCIIKPSRFGDDLVVDGEKLGNRIRMEGRNIRGIVYANLGSAVKNLKWSRYR